MEVVEAAVVVCEVAVPIGVVAGRKMILAKEAEAVVGVEGAPARHGKEEVVALGHSLHGWERVLEGKVQRDLDCFPRLGEQWLLSFRKTRNELQMQWTR